jgi:tetratricopeptide (TPR) repeat protein
VRYDFGSEITVYQGSQGLCCTSRKREPLYSLDEQDKSEEAKIVYSYLLRCNPNNSSVLNNLSNIYKRTGDLDAAWDLIQKAYSIYPEDDIISRNFDNLAGLIQERDEKEALFQSSLETLQRENEFVIRKLSNFVSNSKKDKDYSEGIIPIPQWKFKVLIGTDEQKSLSLRDQWLRKGYLRDTGRRGKFNERVYEVNPYLSRAIVNLQPKTINPTWIKALSELDSDLLESLEYYDIINRVKKVKKSIRKPLERDIDELYINHILKNDKAVIVLSGSVVELLLIYYLEKKKTEKINYQRGNRKVEKKLYESDLGDLLNYCEENNHLKNIVVYMGNISRLNRNYIHPGKELKDGESLTTSQANLCFAATLEILKAII